MAKANTFRINPAKTEAIAEQKVRGQAAIVLRELQRDPSARLGADIDAEIQAREPFTTRQDSLRVTLYYLVIFAKRGWVIKEKPAPTPEATAEASQEVDEVPEFVEDTDEVLVEA